MSKGPTLLNIMWIVAIVLLLTFLVIVVAWMSSGKLKVESDIAESDNAKPITESEIQANSFIPELNSRTQPKPISPETNLPEAQAETSKQEPPPVPPKQKEEKKDPAPAEAKSSYALQVGAFSSPGNAGEFEKRLQARGFSTATKPKGNLTAVFIIGITTQDEAITLKEKLEKENISSSVLVFP